MEEIKNKSHKRNMIICVTLVLSLILIEWVFGFLLGYFRIVSTRAQMANIQIGINVLGGIIFSIIFIWYAFFTHRNVRRFA